MKTINELKEDLVAQYGNLPGVYKITRKSDGKVYIGQTEKAIVDRIMQHINNVHINNNSDNIDKAIKTEGWEAFDYEVELWIQNSTTDQLWDLESQYIAKYNSCDNGFNLTKGNHVGKTKQSAGYVMHTIRVDAFKKYIAKPYNLNFTGKKVLLTNSFGSKVKDYLDYEDCEVINIYSSDYVENKNGKLEINKELYGEYIMEELDKLKDKHFDIIIANPPYGKIGANITKKIIDSIDFDEYINLLPANDYIRNDDKDLFKYVEVSTMQTVNDAFDDAAVTTHVARINKRPCNYISWDEFKIENYIDDNLTKYFYENLKRYNKALAESSSWCYFSSELITNNNTVLLDHRCIPHKHLAYSKNTAEYKWNIEKSLDLKTLAQVSESASTPGKINKYTIVFEHNIEKDNFVNFIYSKDGFRFISKLFTAVNSDSTADLNNILPKVDWSRAWTVEEILKDYGYTDKEIKEVMDDLVNFKGMED